MKMCSAIPWRESGSFHSETSGKLDNHEWWLISTIWLDLFQLRTIMMITIHHADNFLGFGKAMTTKFLCISWRC